MAKILAVLRQESHIHRRANGFVLTGKGGMTMSEREKVIGFLQETEAYFRKCRSNASFASKAENHFLELQNAANETAELLKEQEHVEPLAIRKDIVDEVYDWIAECPACGMTWAMWHPDRMRFCPGCGKAVKWND